MKGIFADKPVSLQLLLLLAFVAFGGIVASILGLGVLQLIYGSVAQMGQNPDMMRLLQFITACGTFLFPALATAWFCSRTPSRFLNIGGMPEGRLVLLVILGVILLNPLVNLTSMWNESLQLPEWASPVENWMRAQEDNALHFTDVLIGGGGTWPLVTNLIVIALTAAVSEEFLFRGTIQNLLFRGSGNVHLIVWVTAILFSAFHLQFYGFVPRMLLGAFFGYLLVWTRNIWLPVIGHFFNNAASVIVLSDASLKENEYVNGKISEASLYPYLLLAVVATIAFVYLCKYIRRYAEQKEV